MKYLNFILLISLLLTSGCSLSKESKFITYNEEFDYYKVNKEELNSSSDIFNLISDENKYSDNLLNFEYVPKPNKSKENLRNIITLKVNFNTDIKSLYSQVVSNYKLKEFNGYNILTSEDGRGIAWFSDSNQKAKHLIFILNGLEDEIPESTFLGWLTESFPPNSKYNEEYYNFFENKRNQKILIKEMQAVYGDKIGLYKEGNFYAFNKKNESIRIDNAYLSYNGSKLDFCLELNDIEVEAISPFNLNFKCRNNLSESLIYDVITISQNGVFSNSFSVR